MTMKVHKCVDHIDQYQHLLCSKKAITITVIIISISINTKREDFQCRMGKTQGDQRSRREESASSQHSWSSGSTSSTASSDLSDPDATLHFLRQSYAAAQSVSTGKAKHPGANGT